MGSQQVEFNNTPFIVTETRKLDCQFGEHYFKERVRKNTKRIILQGTRKIGCLAKVIVKQLNLFPEYSISANLLNKKQLRNEREKQLLQLKEDLANCKVTVHRANKYFVSLPTKEAHNILLGLELLVLLKKYILNWFLKFMNWYLKALRQFQK